IRSTALNIFATNALPPFAGGPDRGIQRRLMLLEFNRTIPDSEMVINIGVRCVQEEAHALLALAVQGVSRVIRNGALTVPPSSVETAQQWLMEADPVVGWMNECTQYDETAVVKQSVARDNAAAWARSQGYPMDRFPAAQGFARRIRGADARIKRGET